MAGGRTLDLRVETFPVHGAFVIARGSRSETTVVTVGVEQNGFRGWGECGPSAHYGESPDSVSVQIETVRGAIEDGAGRHRVLDLLPAGAARNAVDAALWDLEARTSGRSVAQLTGLGSLRPVRTVCTISVASPAAMAADAARLADFETLKLKLDGEQDVARVEAVRRAAPRARLIVDANESWPPQEVATLLQAMADLGVELVEQPTSPDDDGVLAGFEHPIPVCADEAFHTVDHLGRMRGRYDFVNLKLDKTGGLTHALVAQKAARDRGFGVMVGCMLGTSLAMAPGLVLAQQADFVDLDGPLLLARDRVPGLQISAGGWLAANPDFWGG